MIHIKPFFLICLLAVLSTSSSFLSGFPRINVPTLSRHKYNLFSPITPELCRARSFSLRDQQGKNSLIETKGQIVEALPNGQFKVSVSPSLPAILCTISGKIRKHSIRLLVGDQVTLELSPYDTSKGRITFRNRT